MALIQFNREEFNRFLGTIEWLRYCRITWEGRASLAMAQTQGEPGKETITERQYGKGEVIEPIDMAMVLFAYVKGGYHSETGDGPASNARKIAERELALQRARDAGIGARTGDA